MCYFGKAISPKTANKSLNDLVKTITKSNVKFDFIVLRGMSGAIFANSLTIALKKPIVILRKKEDSSHGCEIEYERVKLKNSSYIFVDDGINDGYTLVDVIKIMSKEKATLNGVFLYDQNAVNHFTLIEKDGLYKNLRNNNINFRIVFYDVERKKRIVFRKKAA